MYGSVPFQEGKAIQGWMYQVEGKALQRFRRGFGGAYCPMKRGTLTNAAVVQANCGCARPLSIARTSCTRCWPAVAFDM